MCTLFRDRQCHADQLAVSRSQVRTNFQLLRFQIVGSSNGSILSLFLLIYINENYQKNECKIRKVYYIFWSCIANVDFCELQGKNLLDPVGEERDYIARTFCAFFRISKKNRLESVAKNFYLRFISLRLPFSNDMKQWICFFSIDFLLEKSTLQKYKVDAWWNDLYEMHQNFPYF